MVTRAYEHAQHRGRDLVSTSATRVLAAARWLGNAIGYTVATIALSSHIVTSRSTTGGQRSTRFAG